MNEIEVRGLKWILAKIRGCNLYFSIKIYNIHCYVRRGPLSNFPIIKKKKIHWIIVYGHCKGIINFSSQNRVASMDGLLVITSLLTPHVLLDSQNFSIMCVFCIHLICQKVLPVARGDGNYQKLFLLECLYSLVSRDCTCVWCCWKYMVDGLYSFIWTLK